MEQPALPVEYELTVAGGKSKATTMVEWLQSERFVIFL